MVKYHLSAKEYARQVDNDSRSPILQEHQLQIDNAVKSQKILFRGETPREAEEGDSSEIAVSQHPKEVFYLYHALDEREPHGFLKADALY